MKGNHMTSQVAAAGIRLFSLEDLLQSSRCHQALMAIGWFPLSCHSWCSSHAHCIFHWASMSRPSCVATANMGGKAPLHCVVGKSSHGRSRYITDLQQEIHTHRSWHRHHQTSDPLKTEQEDTHTNNIQYIAKKTNLNHPQDPKKTSPTKKATRKNAAHPVVILLMLAMWDLLLTCQREVAPI